MQGFERMLNRLREADERDPFPTEAADALADWAGRRVAISYAGDGLTPFEVTRVREWVRFSVQVQCEDPDYEQALDPIGLDTGVLHGPGR